MCDDLTLLLNLQKRAYQHFRNILINLISIVKSFKQALSIYSNFHTAKCGDRYKCLVFEHTELTGQLALFCLFCCCLSHCTDARRPSVRALICDGEVSRASRPSPWVGVSRSCAVVNASDLQLDSPGSILGRSPYIAKPSVTLGR